MNIKRTCSLPEFNQSFGFFFFRTTADQINNEINALDTKIQKIKKQIELPTTEPDIQEQMTAFLRVKKKKNYNNMQ